MAHHHSKPLSRRQVQVLAQVARRAFAHVAALASARGETFEESTAAFDTWRHEQVFAACGRRGLRDARNTDYRLILARFQSLLGHDDKALASLLLAQSEPRRQAEALLVREMERGGFGPAYVQAICSDAFKIDVADAKPEQLMKLTFTLRNRIAARRRAARTSGATIACPAS